MINTYLSVGVIERTVTEFYCRSLIHLAVKTENHRCDLQRYFGGLSRKRHVTLDSLITNYSDSLDAVPKELCR